MRVTPKSTFMLPLQAPGFGNEVSRSQGIEDRQRGDLVVAICPPATPYCFPPTPAPSTCPTTGVPPNGYYLKTRYVTKVMPHPASNAGLNGRLDVPAYGNDWGLVGQDLALLEVPEVVCPGLYRLSVRARQVGSSEGVNEEFAPDQGSLITVLAAPAGEWNPMTANPFGSLDVPINSDLAALVPNPEAAFHLQQLGWTSNYPAAAEIEVTYPARVQILGAYLGQNLGIQSLVSWRVDAIQHRVTISIVDPTRCTNDLRIVFHLIDTQLPVLPVNLLTEFTTTPQSQRLYNLNGSLISGNPYVVGTFNTLPICGSG